MHRSLALLVGLLAAAFFAVPALAQTGTGYVEICKTAGTPAVTGAASFMVNGSIPATVNVGECSAPIEVPAGTATIQEVNTTSSDGFNTNDYTSVTAIHTSAPGAPDSALVSSDLSARTTTVNVAAGDTSTGTTVSFTNALVQGYFEICKQQVTGAGLDGQSYTFSVAGAMGFTQSVSVTVGACSAPIQAPSGHVNVTETGSAAFVTSIVGMPSASLLGSDVAAGTASVAVPANGTISGESIVTFTNNSSQLKICKVAGDAALVGQSYGFTVNGQPVSVTAGTGGGNCVLAGRFRAGTPVSVTEAPSAGVMLNTIAISPSDRTFTQSGSDFAGQTANLTMGSGETVLTFTNVLATPGLLKICKLGVGSGPATFTVSGPRGTAPAITQGTDTVTVPIGQCALLPNPYPYAGIQTVTETPMSGFAPTSITVADPDRLAGTADLAGGSVGAYIGTGVTVVTFTNGAVAPTTSGSGGSTSGGSTSGGSTSGGTAAAAATATATTASVATPKAARVALVATVRVLRLRSGRYLIVRVNGAARMARIHLTLMDKHHHVLRRITRYVRTNRMFRVRNLRLAPTVRSVKVMIA